MPRRSGYNADDALRLTPLGTHPAAGKSVELLVEKYGLTMCGSDALRLTPLGTHPAAGKSVELLVEKYGLTMCGSLSLN